MALQGPSGCGKSTLLHILGALDAPTAGTVSFRGTPLDRVRNLPAFRAKSVGFIFQAACLLPTLSALENVQIPMFEISRTTSPSNSTTSRSERSRSCTAMALARLDFPEAGSPVRKMVRPGNA